MQVKNLTLQRLLKEEASIEREPIPNALIARLDVFKFYFCLYNLEGHYSGGFYFGLLQLHQNYPFAAPKLLFYTPSGRFDINLPICTSFTNYHQESWTSAWNVRTLILATISFMYSEQPSYGCCQATANDRMRMARQSLNFNMKNPLFVRLFQQKLVKLNLLAKKVKQQQQNLPHYTSYVPQLRLQQHQKDKQDQLQSEHLEEDRGEQGKEKNRNLFKRLMKILATILILLAILILAIKFL